MLDTGNNEGTQDGWASIYCSQVTWKCETPHQSKDVLESIHSVISEAGYLYIEEVGLGPQGDKCAEK
jgi:hypothetical protein